MDSFDTDSRWWPPSPHKEAVLDILRRGRGHLEERGHNQAPMLVYEDGGSIELPRVRVVDGTVVADGGSTPESGTTKYLDVCGTIDELKLILENEPERAKTDLDTLETIIDDTLYMIDRMERRLNAYRAFADRVEELVWKMKGLGGPDPQVAKQNAEALRTFLREHPEEIGANLETLFRQAEEIRTVAGTQEQVLYPYRDTAIELGALYEEIKGARSWREKGE